MENKNYKLTTIIVLGILFITYGFQMYYWNDLNNKLLFSIWMALVVGLTYYVIWLHYLNIKLVNDLHNEIKNPKKISRIVYLRVIDMMAHLKGDKLKQFVLDKVMDVFNDKSSTTLEKEIALLSMDEYAANDPKVLEIFKYVAKNETSPGLKQSAQDIVDFIQEE